MSVSSRATRAPAGPVDLAVLPTGIREVVTLRGSVDTWPDFAVGEEIVQDWMAGALDKGTRHRDRFEIADILENLGAQVGFSASTSRIRWSARFLRRDFEVVVPLIFEQLLQPAFEEAELEKGRERLRASIQRGISDPGYRADVALARSLFPVSHPNGMFEPDEEGRQIDAAGPEDVRRLHASQLLRGAPRMVLVGDVDFDRARGIVAEAAAAWNPEPIVSEAAPNVPASRAASEKVQIADRDNLEVRWGHDLPLTRLDDDYLAAYMANFILGGNFSARLMDQVRDREGLTYGVGSGFRGADSRHTGAWRLHITLSLEKLERGIEVTERVVREWADGGITEEELLEKQDTLAGSYQVRQATTSGLAGVLLQQMEDGRPLDWADGYPDRIRALTPDAVNGALARYFDPSRLVRVVAGSLPG